MGAMRMRVNHEVPKFIFQLNFLLNIYGIPFTQFWFQIKFTPIKC
jgi:hypothetical protein